MGMPVRIKATFASLIGEYMSKYYINFKCHYDKSIETIEGPLSIKEAMALIKEYKTVNSGYYLSSRATKQFYSESKQH